MSVENSQQPMGTPVMVDGHYFESITEGMWYSYFQQMGMDPNPQPDTFMLDLYQVYTPDFYLPQQDTYVEVKYGNVTQDSIDRAHQLARVTGKMVMLINGRPKMRSTKIAVLGSDTNSDLGTTSVPIYTMSEMQDESFFSEPPYIYSKVIDPTAHSAFIEKRDQGRKNPRGAFIDYSSEEMAELLSEMVGLMDRLKK
jgi:hypothetical protein